MKGDLATIYRYYRVGSWCKKLSIPINTTDVTVSTALAVLPCYLCLAYCYPQKML